MRLALAAIILGALVAAGCGEYELGETGGRSAAPEAVGVAVDPMSLAEPARPKSPPSSPQTPGAKAPGGPAPSAARTDFGAPAPEGSVIREKADVGAGRKGHYSKGFITTPLSTFWRTQEMVAYRTVVPHALDLYKASHGHFPKTQEEFVREILTPNQVQLPELPQGHRYYYDPEKGELLVERPM